MRGRCDGRENEEDGEEHHAGRERVSAAVAAAVVVVAAAAAAVCESLLGAVGPARVWDGHLGMEQEREGVKTLSAQIRVLKAWKIK